MTDLSRHRQGDLAIQYSREIEEATTEHLFGSESDPWLPLPYECEPARYYLSERLHPDGGPAQDHHFEQMFFELFWPGNTGRSPQLLLLEGKSGIGKSTFLTYFFRHYMPHYNKRPEFNEIALGEPERWSAQVARHVVLHVNVRHVRSSKNLKSRLCDEFAKQILSRFGSDGDPLSDWVFGNISEINQYELWDRAVGGWNSGRHSNMPRANFATEDHYRNHYLVEHNLIDNSEVFVDCATHYLSRRTTANGDRRYFITWVFDNADQMPDDVLLDLIEFATNHIEDECPQNAPFAPINSQRSAIWKIVIPLRPETLRRFASSVEPLRNKECLALGPVPHDALSNRREERLETLIQSSERYATVIMSLPAYSKSPIRLLRPKVAARALCDSFRAHLTHDTETDTTETAKNIFSGLVNDSARRLLALRGRLTTSRTIQERLDKALRERWEGPRLSAFYFLDGLLCGRDGEFTHARPDNPILNLYDLGQTTNNAASLLVGIHAIWQLMRGDEWHDVVECLAEAGHSRSDLDACRESLIAKEVIRRLGKDNNGVERYSTESSVVNAHWELLRERAYTDNCAICLAVRYKLTKPGEHWRTDSLDYSAFGKRVTYTCRFLSLLHKCQNEFMRHANLKVSDLAQIGATADATASQFPDVYRYVGSEYRKRIASLLRHETALEVVLRQLGELDGVHDDIMQLPSET